MIIIELKKKENYVNYVKISGHSGYKEAGSDIVCASISSIAITTVNAIIRIDNNAITYSEDDGLLEIKVLKYNDIINTLIENMLDLFECLQKDYKEYIKIR